MILESETDKKLNWFLTEESNTLERLHVDCYVLLKFPCFYEHFFIVKFPCFSVLVWYQLWSNVNQVLQGMS